MPITTARDLVTSALVTAGVIEATETPDNKEIVDGLDQLNSLIDTLSLDNLWPYTYTELKPNLSSGVAEYTIGATGDIVGGRPNEIVAISVVDTNAIIPLKQYSNQDWYTISKTDNVDGRPRYFRYRADNPNGTIEFYPIPERSYEVIISYRDLITEYGINDILDLPVGYKSYFEYGLGSLLGVRYGINVDRISAIAASRLDRIKVQNTEKVTMGLGNLPVNKSNGGYNIYTDSYNGAWR